MIIFKKNIYAVIFLIFVVLISGSALTITENVTLNLRSVQHDNEILRTLQQIFSKAGSYIYNVETELYTIYNNDNKLIGYAFYAEGRGFTGATEDGFKMGYPMVILVGLEDKNTIKGIVVIEENEDRPWWLTIVNSNFFDQFINLKIEDCILTKSGGKVDGVTGATLSSKSVVDIVRQGAMNKIKYIK